MPRWEGDGRERLEGAALDLFLEIGYEATTVAAIARRAGLTERSFYRHFTDKREVLFAGDEVLIGQITRRLELELEQRAPWPALLEALAAAGEVFVPRDAQRLRTRAISRSAALAERERTKLAALRDAIAAVLEARGTVARDAGLLADLGMSVLVTASEQRLDDPADFADLVLDAAAAQHRLLLDVDLHRSPRRAAPAT